MNSPQDETKAQQFAEEFSKFPLKKRRFLECFAQTGSVNRASQHAGVSRRTHLKWKKEKTFAAAHEEALSVAVDLMESEARRRGVEGTLEPVYYAGKAVGAIRRYSDTMLIFLLKGARPEKYRDNFYDTGGREPQATREELQASIQKKLARLARSQGTGPSADKGTDPSAST